MSRASLYPENRSSTTIKRSADVRNKTRGETLATSESGFMDGVPDRVVLDSQAIALRMKSDSFFWKSVGRTP